MVKSVDSLIVEIHCQCCQQTQTCSVGWLKTNAEFLCEHCGARTAVNANELVDSVRKASVAKSSRAGAKA